MWLESRNILKQSANLARVVLITSLFLSLSSIASGKTNESEGSHSWKFPGLDLGGVITSDPSATVSADNNILIFAVGATGAIHFKILKNNTSSVGFHLEEILCQVRLQ